MPYLPTIHCSQYHCEFHQRPIVLPFPSPPKTERHQSTWPPHEWIAYIACPSCGHTSRYSREDVQRSLYMPQDPEGSHRPKAWFCARFGCGTPGCDTPVELHVQADAAVKLDDLTAKLTEGEISGDMPCGHPLSVSPIEKVEWLRAYGPITGYMPR